MLGKTHLIFGLTTLAVVDAWTGLVQPHPVNDIPIGPVLSAGAAIFGALLPDLDAEDSTIQRELGLAGSLTRLGIQLVGIKHRGVFHSGLAVVLTILAGGLFGWWCGYLDVGLAFGLGYLSHVLADGLTKAGVPLLWPWPKKIHLLPRLLRVRTGGPVETLIFIGMIVILIILLPALINVPVIGSQLTDY